MDVYLIVCFILIISLIVSLYFVCCRINELQEDIDELNDIFDFFDFK